MGKDPDLVIKAEIVVAFERQFGECYIEGIERTTIAVLPAALNTFIVTVALKGCQCTPKCCKEAIAMQYGNTCTFVGENDYDRLEEAAREVIKIAKTSP